MKLSAAVWAIYVDGRAFATDDLARVEKQLIDGHTDDHGHALKGGELWIIAFQDIVYCLFGYAEFGGHHILGDAMLAHEFLYSHFS